MRLALVTCALIAGVAEAGVENWTAIGWSVVAVLFALVADGHKRRARALHGELRRTRATLVEVRRAADTLAAAVRLHAVGCPPGARGRGWSPPDTIAMPAPGTGAPAVVEVRPLPIGRRPPGAPETLRAADLPPHLRA